MVGGPQLLIRSRRLGGVGSLSDSPRPRANEDLVPRVGEILPHGCRSSHALVYRAHLAAPGLGNGFHGVRPAGVGRRPAR